MGIHNFQPYLKKTYPFAYKEKWLDSYDNLYIDLNCVLHHICYVSTSKNDILLRTKDYILGIINYTNPQKRIIILADGPAPLAKLILQRKRRLDKVDVVNAEPFSEDIYLEINFTPGTDFMLKLENNLSDFKSYIETTYNLDVIMSITDPGEGEIKIRKILQDLQYNNLIETHIVYSGDSDMILLLFTCHSLNNIYLTPKKNEIISLYELYNNHISKFGKTKTSKYDFVFINLLMGNDYIPKVLYITLDKIWTTYAKISKYYTDGLISHKYNRIKIDPLFLHDLLYITSKNIAKGYLNRFKLEHIKNKYYKNYIDGLYWCFSMYITGICSDYRYIYNYINSPHITGVMLTLMANNIYTITESPSIDSNLYGILLIPYKAINILSDKNKQLVYKIKQKYPILYEEEECKECQNYKKKKMVLNNQRKHIGVNTLERDIINKEIKCNTNKYTKHKNTHIQLTYDIIEEINRYYNICSNDIIETVNNTEKNIEKYIPPYVRNINKFNKRLF
jgi:5'-3' exonuclease